VTLLTARNVEDVVPAAPEWLGERASAKWVKLWLLLDRECISPELHGDIVAMYCQAYADFREACDVVNAKGPIIKDDRERIVANPYVQVRDLAARQMAELGKTLGLRPDAPPLMPARRLEDYYDTDGARDDHRDEPQNFELTECEAECSDRADGEK